MHNWSINDFYIKRVGIMIIILIVIIFISVNIVSAAWSYGSLHQHTGYSTVYGYDRNPLTLGDNCAKESLHFLGYSVAELKEEALNLNLNWLSFTDHSYCLSSSEFNTVKTDCQNVQTSAFTCLWGEELSTVDDDASSVDEALCTVCVRGGATCGFIPEFNFKAAHVGANGIDNFISESPSNVWCPSSPSAQSGINSVNTENGFAIINHPSSTNWDFVSIDSVSNYDGIEI